jgi:hypothetical protein
MSSQTVEVETTVETTTPKESACLFSGAHKLRKNPVFQVLVEEDDKDNLHSPQRR